MRLKLLITVTTIHIYYYFKKKNISDKRSKKKKKFLRTFQSDRISNTTNYIIFYLIGDNLYERRINNSSLNHSNE